MPGRGSREDLLDLDLSGVGNGLAPPPPLDQRVLITLSNMAYTRDHVVPRLVESCSKYGQLSYHEIVNPAYGYVRLPYTLIRLMILKIYSSKYLA